MPPPPAGPGLLREGGAVSPVFGAQMEEATPQCPPGRHLSVRPPSPTPSCRAWLGSLTSGLHPTGLPPSPTEQDSLLAGWAQLPQRPHVGCQPPRRKGGREGKPVPEAGGAAAGSEPLAEGVQALGAAPALGKLEPPHGRGAESAQTPLLRKWGAGKVGVARSPRTGGDVSWRMRGQRRGGNGQDSC